MHLKKQLFILFALTLCVVGGNAQTEPTIGDSTVNDSTSLEVPTELQLVEELPEFPGGQQAMMQFLVKNIVYPKQDRRDEKEGTAYIEFVIEKDGSVTMVRLLPGTESRATEAMIEEAIRVVKKMPKWKPGKQQGKPVRVRYRMPIQFKLK